MERIGLSLTDETYKLLKKDAAKHGVTMADVARELIHNGLVARGYPSHQYILRWGGRRKSDKSQHD
jgi:plasmid stability protein